MSFVIRTNLIFKVVFRFTFRSVEFITNSKEKQKKRAVLYLLHFPTFLKELRCQPLKTIVLAVTEQLSQISEMIQQGKSFIFDRIPRSTPIGLNNHLRKPKSQKVELVDNKTRNRRPLKKWLELNDRKKTINQSFSIILTSEGQFRDEVFWYSFWDDEI